VTHFALGDMSMGVAKHCKLLLIIGDGAIDLREDGTIHLSPHGMIDVGHVVEDMIGDGVCWYLLT
jgi:predicted solute-binding protein